MKLLAIFIVFFILLGFLPLKWIIEMNPYLLVLTIICFMVGLFLLYTLFEGERKSKKPLQE